jgi:acyl-coenzyme A thioesterase PaaI-like protein
VESKHRAKEFIEMGKSHQELFAELMEIVRNRMGDQINRYQFPPPVFETMQGEFQEINPEAGTLTARFPILEEYSNPYGTMQGGMIAAAVDNSIGPLSVMVAPANVTRTLETKYNQPVRIEMDWIIVKAKYIQREGRKLFFEARVESPEGEPLAKSKAVHWIVDNSS